MKRNYYNNTGYGKRYNLNHNPLYTKINKNVSVFNNLTTDIITDIRKRSGSTVYRSCFLLDTNINSEFHYAINNSMVMKLAIVIIQNLDLEAIRDGSNKIFMNDYYSPCIDRVINSELFKTIDDIELLLLFLKQLTMILRNSGIFNNNDENITEDDFSVFYFNFYIKLFNSFWNNVNWRKLFPSMPDFAASVQARKKLIIDLMTERKKNEFRIDELSNSFINITGLGKTNDVFLISFFDFYVFTWLSHFGIIQYLDGYDPEPVMVNFTRHGRNLLQFLPL